MCYGWSLVETIYGLCQLWCIFFKIEITSTFCDSILNTKVLEFCVVHIVLNSILLSGNKW